jgi:hypothetical protein
MAQSLRTVRVLTLGTTGTQDITISGFGTCIGAIFDMNVGDTDNTVQTTDRSSIGFCDGTRQAVSAVGSGNGNTTTETARLERDNAVIVDLSGNQSIAGLAVFDSFITDGVRINVTTASANRFCNVTLIGGDATNVYVNYSPALGTSAGNTVISTVGFEPDLVQASCTGLGAVNSVAAHSIITRGIAVNDGADANFMRGAFDQSGISTTNTGSYVSNVYSIGQFFNNTLGWGASIGSYTSNGFTVTTNTDSNDDIFAYIAIKFADTFVKAEIEDSPSTTGSSSLGATPSTPNFLQIIGSGASALNTATAGLNESDSYFDATNQYSASSYSVDNVSTSDNGKINKSGGLRQLDSSGATEINSTFTAFTSTGATFNFSPTVARKFITLFVGETGGALTITESVATLNMTSVDPVIDFTGLISIVEGSEPLNITSIDPTVTLTATLTITESTSTLNITNNDPDITLTAPDTLVITESAATLNITTQSPNITLSGTLSIVESTKTIDMLTRNPSVTLGLPVYTQTFTGIQKAAEFTGTTKLYGFTGTITELQTFSGTAKAASFLGVTE